MCTEGWGQRYEPGTVKRDGFSARLKKVAHSVWWLLPWGLGLYLPCSRARNSVRLCFKCRVASGLRERRGSGVVRALCWADFVLSWRIMLSSASLSECKDEIVSISARHRTARMSSLKSSGASLSRLRKRCGCTQSLLLSLCAWGAPPCESPVPLSPSPGLSLPGWFSAPCRWMANLTSKAEWEPPCPAAAEGQF